MDNINKMENTQTKSKKWKVIAIVLIVVVVLIIVLDLSSGKKGGIDSATQNDPLAMVDLTMRMQSDLGLKNVLISEVAGSVLEVRIDNPSSVSKSGLDNGTAFVFGYIVTNISGDTQKIRVIYTASGADKILYQANTSDINDWKSGKISDEIFAKKIEHVDLTLNSAGK